MAHDEWAFSILKMIVLDELDGVRSALRVAQQSVRATSEARLRQFETELEGSASNTPERTKLESQYFAWRSWYKSYLPRLMAGSFLTYMFAVVEDVLREFARNAQRDKNLVLALRDIHGRPVDKALTYLQKAAGLDVGSLPGWQVLREFQDLRNALLHRTGRLGDDARELANFRRLVSRFPNMLTVADWSNRDSLLEFGPELVEQFATEADALFEELLRKMYP